MVMDWRTARHLGAGSAESYDGTRREARLPELTGGQLQAFIAVGQSGAPHKQAWRTLEAYRDGDRDTARAPEVEPQPADWESVASGSLDAQRSEFERNRPYLVNGLRHRCLARAREIRLTAQLNHPHILPLLDSGEGAGLLYCIMPLVEGESLGSGCVGSGGFRLTMLGRKLDQSRRTRGAQNAVGQPHVSSTLASGTEVGRQSTPDFCPSGGVPKSWTALWTVLRPVFV